jgi:hypothetical protein
VGFFLQDALVSFVMNPADNKKIFGLENSTSAGHAPLIPAGPQPHRIRAQESQRREQTT